jgi:hypothetical protein
VAAADDEDVVRPALLVRLTWSMLVCDNMPQRDLSLQ